MPLTLVPGQNKWKNSVLYTGSRNKAIQALGWILACKSPFLYISSRRRRGKYDMKCDKPGEKIITQGLKHILRTWDFWSFLFFAFHKPKEKAW